MVFQDYELIHTKRVNRERLGTNPYTKRYFNALGGWNTLFVTALSGLAGYQVRNVCRKHTLMLSST